MALRGCLRSIPSCSRHFAPSPLSLPYKGEEMTVESVESLAF